jgi:hypothetical protein
MNMKKIQIFSFDKNYLRGRIEVSFFKNSRNEQQYHTPNVITSVPKMILDHKDNKHHTNVYKGSQNINPM